MPFFLIVNYFFAIVVSLLLETHRQFLLVGAVRKKKWPQEAPQPAHHRVQAVQLRAQREKDGGNEREKD